MPWPTVAAWRFQVAFGLFFQGQGFPLMRFCGKACKQGQIQKLRPTVATLARWLSASRAGSAVVVMAE